MKTTNDIVREMREFADTDSQSIGRDVLRRRIHKFADLIKKAHEFELAVEKAKAAGEGYAAGKQSVTDCNQHETVDIVSRCIYGEAKDAEPVGNAAKMREALETISKCDISKEEDCYTLYRVCEAALSAPARNCDLLNSSTACDEFEKFMGLKPSKNIEERDAVMRENWFGFLLWLFAEAKGGETK